MSRYIPTNKTYLVIDLVDLFIDKIIKNYSMLRGIVLDRGLVFTSTF